MFAMIFNSDMIVDVLGIIDKCLCYFDNHAKDERHQQSFLIGSYPHQNTKFNVIREKIFTLILCLPEELALLQCHIYSGNV